MQVGFHNSTMSEEKIHQQIEMNEAATRSVQDWGGICSDAQPFATSIINPGINKALPPHVGLSSFDSLCSEHPGCDGSSSEHTHTHGLGRDLLLLGLRWLHGGEKFCFGLNRAVIVNQHNLIVEDIDQCSPVTQVVCLVPGFFQSDDFRLDSRTCIILR